jgi:hypothetical protein
MNGDVHHEGHAFAEASAFVKTTADGAGVVVLVFELAVLALATICGRRS